MAASYIYLYLLLFPLPHVVKGKSRKMCLLKIKVTVENLTLELACKVKKWPLISTFVTRAAISKILLK